MKTYSKERMIVFDEKGDERGNLAVVEELVNIPFKIKRVFYMYNARMDALRGNHANRKSEFILISIAGQCKVKIHGIRGEAERVYCLTKPTEGLYIPVMVWKEMYDFSKDAVLLVLASEYYDEKEYVRDYQEYQNLIYEGTASDYESDQKNI